MPRRTSLLLAAITLAAGALLWISRPRVLLDEGVASERIRVVERADGVRELYMGESRNRQTALHPDRPGELVLPYTRVAVAGMAPVPRDSRVLFVGLGGGAMPRYLLERFRESLPEAVELEPRVVEAARRWFGLPPDTVLPVHVGDGRAFIEAAPAGRWDVVVLDAFSGGEVPRALATVEFLQEVRRVLAARGVAVGNLHTTAPEYDAMVATYRAVFPEVALIEVPRRRQVVILASGEAKLGREELLARVRDLTAARDPGFDLERLVARGWKAPPPGTTSVLRDEG